MKLEWKACFRVCASLFLLYLCVYYWAKVSRFLSAFLGALSPLLLGLVIAYVLNILIQITIIADMNTCDAHLFKYSDTRFHES